ncbi:YbaB/EbfC family nucleoid-associated protein [Sphaerisporangium viridialbum]|uniref:YbaB/EbfC family nucleoid-associated protein n=1 Tax=Sphaerisporangium viridialbum TaxID=46189 RepID=UPI003C75EB49
MTSAPYDSEHLHAYLRQAQDSMRALQEAQERISQVTGQGASGDDLIRATCDGRGGITGVFLNPRAMRRDRVTLGRDVAAALQAAQQDAECQTQAIVNEALDGTADLPEPPDAGLVRTQIERVAHEILGG